MARVSTRDKAGALGGWDGDGDGVRGELGASFEFEGTLRLGMLGMDDLMVRFDGSYTISYTGCPRKEERLLGSAAGSDIEIRAAAVAGEEDAKSGFWRGPSWWWMLE